MLGIEAAQLSCFDVGKGLKLEEDLIKPNPTHWSVHWLKLSQARGIATVLMYGERRRCTDIPKGYARGNWSGLARVESVADSMGQPIGETVGQLENTDTSLIQCDTMDERREIFSLLVSSGRLLSLSTGEVCPEEAVCLLCVQQRVQESQREGWYQPLDSGVHIDKGVFQKNGALPFLFGCINAHGHHTLEFVRTHVHGSVLPLGVLDRIVAPSYHAIAGSCAPCRFESHPSCA